MLTACPFGLCLGVTDVPSTVVAIGAGFGVLTDDDLLIFSDSMSGHGNDSIVGVRTFYKNKNENKIIIISNSILCINIATYVHANSVQGTLYPEFEKRSQKLDKYQDVDRDLVQAYTESNNEEPCYICNIKMFTHTHIYTHIYMYKSIKV